MAQRASIGVVGLGVMGRNLALNFASRDIRVVGTDRDPQARARTAEAGPVEVVEGLEALFSALGQQRPRTILLSVPASALDAALDELLQVAGEGDVILDGGNSHFRRTAARQHRAAERGVMLLGVGISGGAEGARLGPSIMVGGPERAWQHAQPLLEAIAARAPDGQPCAAWFGPGGMGHWVKMVHNAIEYAEMQLIAETYDRMRLARMSHESMATAFDWAATDWRRSFLLDATAAVLRTRDPGGEGMLLDRIEDRAGQKGTGRWVALEALEHGVPAPTLVEAVEARSLSSLRPLRQAVEADDAGLGPALDSATDVVIEDMDVLADALTCARLVSWAQGVHLMVEVARQVEPEAAPLDVPLVLRTWRAGCIIRSAFLDPVAEALEAHEDREEHLLRVDPVRGWVADRQGALRAALCDAQRLGVAEPAHGSALAYLDGLRRGLGPSNMIQAQRDLFGAHTYRRLDRPGSFHTEGWGTEAPVEEGG